MTIQAVRHQAGTLGHARSRSDDDIGLIHAEHAELLARDGAYAHMWNLQLQEEEERPKITVGNGLTPA